MLFPALVEPLLPPAADPELVLLALAGDTRAFSELYLRYVKRITSLVGRMLHRVSEREEVTQEIFLEVHLSLHRFEGRSSFYTWIFRLATNVTLHHLRASKQRYRVGVLTEAAEATLVRPAWLASSDPERDADYNALLAETTRVIDALIPSQRAIMMLGPVNGGTLEHMAAVLGVSSAVAKSRLHRARSCAKDSMWRAERRGVPFAQVPAAGLSVPPLVVRPLVVSPIVCRTPLSALVDLPLDDLAPILVVSA